MTDRPSSDAAGTPAGDDLPEVGAAFEVASALHDGEASDAERAAADAEVRSQSQVVGAVARRVGDVPPAPRGLLDDHVAAALAAFDDLEPVPVGRAAPVASLTGRRPWWQRVPLGAVAAAVAVIALVGALGIATRSDDDQSADSATAALDDASGDDAMSEREAEAFDADGGAGAGGTTGSAGPLATGERPAFATYDELAVALGGRTARSEAATAEDSAEESAPTADVAPVPESSIAAAGCDAVEAAGIDPARVELVAPVVVDGQLVTAVVHRGDRGRQLTSVDEAACAVVDERAL